MTNLCKHGAYVAIYNMFATELDLPPLATGAARMASRLEREKRVTR
jgi:hypothetical protein